tara:strand:+ start:2468 stop:5587 length:3120 start_codon:yes stop_codon:yes gene_type:complete
MARKQVERLRPSAKLQAVARPVETYVRPAAQPVGQSDLGAFVSAIAPAAQTLAQVEKQKQLKLQREAEKGIASARALDAQIGVNKALRAANEDYRLNQIDYLEMSDEQVAARRSEIMQPFIQQAEDSGDDILFKAVKGDLEVGNLAWFTKNYDPAKYTHMFNKNMGTIGDEIIATSDSTAFIPQTEEDGTIEENRSLQIQQIEDLAKKAASAYGYNQAEVNDFIMENIISPRVRENGRDAAYQWAESQKLFGVSRYQKTVRQIERDLAAYDSERAKLGKDAFFTSQVERQIASFLETGDVMSIGGNVSFNDGTSKSIKDEDIIVGIQAVASNLGLSEEQSIKQLYRPLNIIPTADANAIMSGKALLSTGDLTNENLTRLANAYVAYKKVDGYNFTIKDALMSSSEKKLMRAMDYLIEKRGVGPEGASISVIQEAVEMVRTIDPDIAVRKASTTEIQNSLDKGITDISDFDEIKNTNSMLPYIQEGVDIYMQMGISLDEATIQAVKDARKDFIIVESSVGTKHALPLLNTAIDRQGGEAQKLQTYINEEAKRPSTIKAIEARGGTGIVLARTTNPNQFNVSIVNEDGLPVGSLGAIPIATALDPATVRTMISERIQRTLDDDKYVTGSMGVITEPVEKFDTEETVAAGTETLESRGESMPIRQVILPEGFDTSTVEPVTENGEFTGDYLYKGTLPDGSKVTFISPTNPKKVLTEQTVPEPVDQLDEIAGAEAREADEVAPVEQTFLETLRDDVSDIRSVLQKTFGYEKIDADAIMSDTIDKMIPLISNSAGGVGEFFDEAYKNTKVKLTNNKAIIKAKEIISDFPELVSELQLDVRGLFARGKATRGITVNEQATIARSIIAVRDASEKQHNLETKPQLDDALALAAKAKNTTPEIILNQIIKPIAFHESDQTMDANLKQYGDGPARGLMQFEPARFSVSVQRAKNYYSKKLGQAIPEWINSIDLSGDIQKEITTLSGNQQMALAVLDLLEHPEADLGMVVSGKKTIEEFWADNWWQGKDSDRKARIKSFRKSYAKYTQE